LVATGRSAGVGGVRWRGSSAGRKTKTTAGDDVEVVEAGALEDGGSGSSHGRLRSSRRTVFPRAPSNPSFSPLTSPSPPASRWAVRGVDSLPPPEASRVGRAPGVSAAASYSCGRRGGTWTAGMHWGTRGAPRRQGQGRRAALWLWPSAKVVKKEDDDDDVGVTPAWRSVGSTWQRAAVGGIWWVASWAMAG
jgi:hypothetical protein